MDRSLTLLNESTGDQGLGRGDSRTESGRYRGRPRYRTGGPVATGEERSGPALVRGASLSRPAPFPPPRAPLPRSFTCPFRSRPCRRHRGRIRVTIEVRSGAAVMATGGTWMGRVAVRGSPLDLAFVWRAALGIHRGPDGSFFDRALEQACAPAAAPDASGAAARDRRCTWAVRHSARAARPACEVPRLALQPGCRASPVDATSRHGGWLPNAGRLRELQFK